MIEERHRDYSLFFTTPLAANGAFPAQQLRIDTDGPFVLREIGFSGLGGALPQGIAIKFQDDLGRFVEQDYIPSFGELPFSGAALTGYNGIIPFFTPILPQIVYPPNATIVVYVENTNPSVAVEKLRIVFRGVSLHPQGTILNGWAYPQYFREIPFAYAETISITQNPQLNNILNVKPDADFVLRALQFVPVSNASVAFGTEGTGGINFAAVQPGVAGNGIEIIVTNPGTPSQPLVVTANLSARTVSISVATDGGGANISTVAQVVAAVNANLQASQLVIASVVTAGFMPIDDVKTSGGGVIQATFGQDWLIQLKDQNGKYYQTGSNSPAIATAGVFPDSIAGHLTPYAPGILVPEIYLKRNNTLYYDIQAPSVPVSVITRFIGSKVFESQSPC